MSQFVQSALCTLHFVALAAWLVFGARLYSVEAMGRAVDSWLLLQHGQPSPAALLLPPLATALELPLSLVPGLSTIAGNIVSAIAAAVAALALGRVLSLMGLSGWLRFASVFAFLTNPLVWLYGGNGSGEMLFVALVLLAIGQSLRLIDERDASVSSIVALGFLAGLIVLARYAGLALLPVWLLVVRGAAPGSPERATGREAYQLVFALPVFFLLGLWSLTSLIVSGDPLYWLTHQAEAAIRLGAGDPILARATGTAVQIATSTTIVRALVEQLFSAHLVFTLLLVPLGIASWRRNPRAGLIFSVALSLIAAIALSAPFRQQALQLRDLLLLVPITIVAMSAVIGGLGSGVRGAGRNAGVSVWACGRVGDPATTPGALTGVPGTGYPLGVVWSLSLARERELGASWSPSVEDPAAPAMRHTKLKTQNSLQPSAFSLRPSPFAFRLSPFAFRLSPFALRLSPCALLLALPCLMASAMLASNDVGDWPREFLLSFSGRSRSIWRSEEQIARVVADRPLPADVLADDLVAHRIIFLSGRPDRFVTRADPQFDRAVALPAGKVSAVLVPAPTSVDAVSRRYPVLYALGADWAVAGERWPDVGWRLFAVPGRPGAPEQVQLRR